MMIMAQAPLFHNNQSATKGWARTGPPSHIQPCSISPVSPKAPSIASPATINPPYPPTLGCTA